MAFWGIEVKPENPIAHSCEKTRGRLRISQATLGIGKATSKTIVQCNVGNRSPVLLCVLLPNKTESFHLDLEFEEVDDVVFSVIGPRSVYLAGYYIRQSHRSNPESDTESYGVDIENTQSEGSSHRSDGDKYEDSFIDDDQFRVSARPPVLRSKEANGNTLQNDKPKNEKGRDKQHKEKFRVTESENDVNSQENEDEDGHLLSEVRSERAAKTTVPNDGEKIPDSTLEMDIQAKADSACGSEPKKTFHPLDINGKTERETKLPADEEASESKNEKGEFPKKMQTLDENNIHNEVLTDEMDHQLNTENNSINHKLPMSNGKDQQSLELEKPKKKRRRSTNEKICQVETDKDISVEEEKRHEVEPSTNVERSGNHLAQPPELGSGKSKKSKKRRNESHLKGTSTEGIGEKHQDYPQDDKAEQDLLHADSMTKDLPTENGETQEKRIDNGLTLLAELLANDSEPVKNVENALDKGDLNMAEPEMTDNQETTMPMEDEVQGTNALPIQKRTLSNGLIIEELTSGPPEGKLATPGKKVKIYYTGMLKDSRHVFDSNVGKAAFKFRLGDEELIDGWNVGIEGMRVGDKRRLIIPPSLGFGDQTVGENIPPNSWLVYDVELVGVRR